MMVQTCSLHNGNSATVGQDHNTREADYLKYHVNQEHVIPDGYHKTLIHEPVEEAVNRIFAGALEEYNAKKRADTKHPGREIGDYYKYLTEQLEQNKKRKAVKGNKAGFETMQPCYEIILEIGNCNTLNSHSCKDYDPERLDPELAEEMLLEAVQRTKELFTVPAVDRDGNPVMDESGNQKTMCCIEIIGLYIHDDEQNKGIHAHVDYVPVAHNYKRGLAMQPGLTNALKEMGLTQDRIENVAAERTKLMKEKYGIDYHDSDYVDGKGKQLPKKLLSKEQLRNRKVASALVPRRTPRMKLQDLFREKMKEVMLEHDIPIAEMSAGNRDHLEHREFCDLMATMSDKREAELEKMQISGEVQALKASAEELNEQSKAQKKLLQDNVKKINSDKEEIKVLEEKKEALTSWEKKPKSEKELFELIGQEVEDYKPILGGQTFKKVSLPFWNQIVKFLRGYFRMEAENKSLKASVSHKKVVVAEKIIKEKDAILLGAKAEAEGIIKDAKKEATSINSNLEWIRQNKELKNRLGVYERVAAKNPEFRKLVEQEMKNPQIIRHKEQKRGDVAI